LLEEALTIAREHRLQHLGDHALFEWDVPTATGCSGQAWP
jgi:hypothetical protein